MLNNQLSATRMQSQILILAFGNPGRQDDGLGPRCAELLEHYLTQHHPPQPVRIEINYQLTVEDSLVISQAEKVVFIDAATELDRDFSFTAIEPQPEAGWNHHLLSPEGLLYLTKALFKRIPEAYLMAIKGYQFDQFEEKLSLEAEDNVLQAFHYMKKFIAGLEGDIKNL